MDFYTMEQLEILGDAMEEVAEWEDYEEDMEDMSFYAPTDEDLAEMAGAYDGYYRFTEKMEYIFGGM